MRQRLHGFHLAQGGDAETLEQTDCWVLVWIQIKRLTKFHFSLNVSLIAFYFLVSLSVAVENKTHSRSLMKAHVVCFQQNDFILGSYCHRLNPDDFIHSDLFTLAPAPLRRGSLSATQLTQTLIIAPIGFVTPAWSYGELQRAPLPPLGRSSGRLETRNAEHVGVSDGWFPSGILSSGQLALRKKSRKQKLSSSLVLRVETSS